MLLYVSLIIYCGEYRELMYVSLIIGASIEQLTVEATGSTPVLQMSFSRAAFLSTLSKARLSRYT